MTSTFLLSSPSTRLYHDSQNLNFRLISQLLIVYLALIPNFLNPLSSLSYPNLDINGLFKPPSNNHRPKMVGITGERTSGHSLGLSLASYLRLTIWSLLSQILMEPYIYISQNPCKEIRSKLIDAFNQWLEVDKDDLKVITKVVRMLHNASLL